jgi:hypothetical protein
MLNERILARGPRLETRLKSVRKCGGGLRTLTSSAFTGLVATTRATEGDEWKWREERMAALGRAFGIMAVEERLWLGPGPVTSDRVPANHALVIYPHSALKPPASDTIYCSYILQNYTCPLLLSSEERPADPGM